MGTFKFDLLFFSTILLLLLLRLHSTISTTPPAPVCNKRHCGSPDTEPFPFEFPFLLKYDHDSSTDNSTRRCGYPGFDVFCNQNKQALLTLSNSGDFIVEYLSLETQKVWIKDPNKCLPKRFLQQDIDITKDISPFQWDYTNLENVTFLNCTKFTGEEPPKWMEDMPLIPCLSNDKYLIMYVLSSLPFKPWKVSCTEIGFAMVPVRDSSSQPQVIMDALYSEISLRWDAPQCNCQADQYCGFVMDTGLDVTCYNDYDFESQGGNPSTPRRRFLYFFPVLWGISGITFFFWVILSVCKDTTPPRQQQQQETIIEPTNREPPWYVLGLDRSRIEQYPKIQLAETGQLPRSIDNVCSICLSEYKRMDTLRGMPQCNHHFHVDCIDVWLKMNATCPLCRNLPDQGSANLVISSLPPTISYQPSSS